MATTTARRAARTLAATAAGETDAELLARFADGDEAAFAALVARHGGLVLGVCRRALPTVQDAEDACQATFLLLARKAASVMWQASVANWLYTTARRVAARAHRTARRRAARETRPTPPAAPSALDQMTGREAFAALDDELDRLPAVYREVLVLCHLDGLTRDEAAHRLRVPVATVKSRLERGRKKLADALAKRGIGLGAALLAASATSPAGASPPRLLSSVLAAVGGSPPDSVAALAREVAVNTWKTKGLLAVVAVAVMGFGLTTMTASTPGEQPKPSMKAEKPGAKPGEPKKPDATEWTISGKVVDTDGKPVPAELFLARHDGKPESLGKTAADGTFKLPVPAFGFSAYLLVKADGFGLGLHHLRADAGAAEVTFKLGVDAPVRGRVIDTQGRPVAGASVTTLSVSTFATDAERVEHLDKWKLKEFLHQYPHANTTVHLNAAPGQTLSDGRAFLSATTDTDGRFEIAGVGAGRLARLFVRGAGIADVTDAHVVNVAKFDPEPFNRAVTENRKREQSRTHMLPELHGPTPDIITEQEKLIRGVVTDADTGKPRANVEVNFIRVNSQEMILHGWHRARTDKDGRFVIRGSRKHEAYIVEVAGDADAGHMTCQFEAKDTIGFEPIEMKLACKKGLVLTGRLLNKATGKPVVGSVTGWALHDNPFVAKYPTFDNSISGQPLHCHTKADGSFRLVVIPGPIVLQASAGTVGQIAEFAPARPDPNFPKYFQTEDGRSWFQRDGFYRVDLGGNWCRVFDLKPDQAVVQQDIELEPETRTTLRVVDADGKPVAGSYAAGTRANAPDSWFHQDTDEVGVFGLTAAEKRLVAAVDGKKKLVGTVVLTADTKNPRLVLGAGGTATGRVVDADGDPLVGVTVTLNFANESADALHNALLTGNPILTDAKGEFRLDTLFPGQPFHLTFAVPSRDKRRPPQYFRVVTKYTVAKPGEVRKLGDVRLTPNGTDE